MTKNAVIGLYDGYSSLDTAKGGLRLFIESFRFYNKDDKVVIFVQAKNMFPELKTFAEKFDVELANFDEKDMCKWSVFRMEYRFIMYKKWLHNTVEDFNKVLICDTNDVIFFGDPFLIETKSMYCALEKSRFRNHGENESSVRCNTEWLSGVGWDVKYENLSETCLNKSLHEKLIFDKNVVCAGTIFGRSSEIMKFLEFILKQTRHKDRPYDQGWLNKYVRSQSPETLDMVRFEHSKILTLDSIDHSTIPKDEQGFYMNELGERYLIVHQIDRGCHIDNFKQLHARHHE